MVRNTGNSSRRIPCRAAFALAALAYLVVFRPVLADHRGSRRPDADKPVALDDILAASSELLTKAGKLRRPFSSYLQPARFATLGSLERENLRKFALAEYAASAGKDADLETWLALLVEAIDWQPFDDRFKPDRALGIAAPKGYVPATARNNVEKEVRSRTASADPDRVERLIEWLRRDYGTIPSSLREKLHRLPPAELQRLEALATSDTAGLERALTDPKLAEDAEVTERAYRAGVAFNLSPVPDTGDRRDGEIAKNRRAACEALKTVEKLSVPYPQKDDKNRRWALTPDLVKLFNDYYRKRRGITLEKEIEARERSGRDLYGRSFHPEAWEHWISVHRYLIEECRGLNQKGELAVANADRHRRYDRSANNVLDPALLESLKQESLERLGYWVSLPNVRSLMPVDYMKIRLAELDRDLRFYSFLAVGQDIMTQARVNDLFRQLESEKAFLLRKLFGARVGLGIFWDTGILKEGEVHPFHNDFDWKKASPSSLRTAKEALSKLSLYETVELERHVKGRFDGQPLPEGVAGFLRDVESHRAAKTREVAPLAEKLKASKPKQWNSTYSDAEWEMLKLDDEALLDIAAYLPSDSPVHASAKEILSLPRNLYEIRKRAGRDARTKQPLYDELDPDERLEEIGHLFMDGYRKPDRVARESSLRPLADTKLTIAEMCPRDPEHAIDPKHGGALLFYFKGVLADNGENKVPLLQYTLCFKKGASLEDLLARRAQLLRDLETVLATVDGYHPQYARLSEISLAPSPTFKRILSLALANAIRSIDKALVQKKPSAYRGKFDVPIADYLETLKDLLPLVGPLRNKDQDTVRHEKAIPADIRPLADYLKKKHGISIPSASLGALAASPPAVKKALRTLVEKASRLHVDDEKLHDVIAATILDPGSWTAEKPGLSPASLKLFQGIMLGSLDDVLAPLKPPFKIDSLETLDADQRERLRDWAKDQLKKQVTRSTPQGTVFANPQQAAALALLKNAIDERGHPEEALEALIGGVNRHEPHEVYRAILDEEEALKKAGCLPPADPPPPVCERLTHYRRLLDTHGRGMPSQTRARLASPDLKPHHFDSLRRLEAILGHLKEPSGKKDALDALMRAVVSPDPETIENASSIWDRDYYEYVNTPYGRKQALESVVRSLVENDCRLEQEARDKLATMARLLAESDARVRLGGREVARADLDRLVLKLLNGDGAGNPGTRHTLEREVRLEAARRVVMKRIDALKKQRERDPKLKGKPLTKQDIVALKLLDDKVLRCLLEPIARQEMELDVRRKVAAKHKPGSPEYDKAVRDELYVDPDAATKRLKPERQQEVEERLHSLLAFPDGSIERVPREAFVQDFLRDNLYACIEYFETNGMKIPATTVTLDSPRQRERVEIWEREMTAVNALKATNLRELRMAQKATALIQIEIGVLKPRVDQQEQMLATLRAQRVPRSKEIESMERYHEQNKATLRRLERELEKALAKEEVLGFDSDPEILRAENAAKEKMKEWIDKRFPPDKEFPSADKLWAAATQKEVLDLLRPTIRKRFKIQLEENKFETDEAKENEFVEDLTAFRAHRLLRDVEHDRRLNALRVKTDIFDREARNEESEATENAEERYRALAEECLKYLKRGDKDKKREPRPFPLADEDGDVAPSDLAIVADAIRKYKSKHEQAEALVKALQPPPGVDGDALRASFTHPSHSSLYRELKAEMVTGEHLPFKMPGEDFDRMMAGLNERAGKERDRRDSALTRLLDKLRPYGFTWNGASLDWKKAKLWKIGKEGPIKSLAELRQVMEGLGEYGIYAGTGSNPWEKMIDEIRVHYTGRGAGDYVRQFRWGDDNVVRIDPGLDDVERVGTPSRLDFLLDPEHAERHIAFLKPSDVEPDAQRVADRLRGNLERFSKLSREVANLSRSLLAAEIVGEKGEYTRKAAELAEVLAQIRRDIPELRAFGRIDVQWKDENGDSSPKYALHLADVLNHQLTHVTGQEYHILSEQAEEDLEASRDFYREWIATEVATYFLTAGLGNLATVPTKLGRVAKIGMEVVGGVKLGYRFALANKVITEAYENNLWFKPLDQQVAMRPTSLKESAHRMAWTFGALGPVKHFFRMLRLNPLIADPLAMGVVSYTVNRSFGDPHDKSLRQAIVMMPLAFPWEELAGPVIANVSWLKNRPWLARSIAVPTVIALNSASGIGVALFEHYFTEEGYAGLDGKKMTNPRDVALHAFFTNIGQDTWGGMRSTANLKAETLRARILTEPNFTVEVAHRELGTPDATGKPRADDDVRDGMGAVQVRQFDELVSRRDNALSPTEKKRLGDLADEMARTQGFKDADDMKFWLEAYAASLPAAVRPKYQELRDIGPVVREFARTTLTRRYAEQKGRPDAEFKSIDDLLAHPMFSSQGRLAMDAARHIPVDELNPNNPRHEEYLRQMGDEFGMGGDRLVRFFKEEYKPQPGDTAKRLARAYAKGQKMFEQKLAGEGDAGRKAFLPELFPDGAKAPTGYHAEARWRVDDVINKAWVWEDISIKDLKLASANHEHHLRLVKGIAKKYGLSEVVLVDAIREHQRNPRPGRPPTLAEVVTRLQLDSAGGYI